VPHLSAQREVQIYDLIDRHGVLSRRELAQLTGLSEQVVLAYLLAGRKAGVLSLSTRGCLAYWFVRPLRKGDNDA